MQINLINRDFADTIHRCRVMREFNEGTWITDEMEKGYTELATFFVVHFS